MANQILRLQCTCGDSIMLFKYYPDHGYVNDDEKLTDWLNEHALLCGGSNINDLSHLSMRQDK